jgi:hypothetical protein
MLQYFYENMFASTMKIVNEGITQRASVSLTFDKFIGMQQQYTDRKKAGVVYYHCMAVRSVLPNEKIQSNNFTHFMDMKFDPLP